MPVTIVHVVQLDAPLRTPISQTAARGALTFHRATMHAPATSLTTSGFTWATTQITLAQIRRSAARTAVWAFQQAMASSLVSGQKRRST